MRKASTCSIERLSGNIKFSLICLLKYLNVYFRQVFSSNAMPHIYDFEPLQCNNTDWYGCIATKNSARLVKLSVLIN